MSAKRASFMLNLDHECPAGDFEAAFGLVEYYKDIGMAVVILISWTINVFSSKYLI